jgi:hypothetical protein
VWRYGRPPALTAAKAAAAPVIAYGQFLNNKSISSSSLSPLSRIAGREQIQKARTDH